MPWLAVILIVLMAIFGSPAAVAGDTVSLPPGTTFRDCSNCPEMVVIPAGEFLMGSSAEDTERASAAIPGLITRLGTRRYVTDEQPRHLVRIRQKFGLGKYPVTHEEFDTFLNGTGYTMASGCVFFDNHQYRPHSDGGWRDPGFSQTNRDPVVCVSWDDANAYVKWLNTKTRGPAATNRDGPYRLPSEAEWEYAARGGQITARWWGDDVGWNNANCDGCGSRWDGKGTAPVGSFRANQLGIGDVLGGVSQWTADCWTANYDNAPPDGAARRTADCESQATRGGDWSSSPWNVSSASRTRAPASKRMNLIGFRVARSISPE